MQRYSQSKCHELARWRKVFFFVLFSELLRLRKMKTRRASAGKRTRSGKAVVDVSSSSSSAAESSPEHSEADDGMDTDEFENEVNDDLEQPFDVDVTTRPKEDLNELRTQVPIVEFLQMMDSVVEPVIPDAVTDYYLARSGLDCPDVRIKRLLALAAQKFISDVAQDAFQYCKIRQQAGGKDTSKSYPSRTAQSAASSSAARDRKTVLTMDDLSAALSEYGVNIKRQDYHT